MTIPNRLIRYGTATIKETILCRHKYPFQMCEVCTMEYNEWIHDFYRFLKDEEESHRGEQ